MYSKIHLTQCNEFGQSRRQTRLPLKQPGAFSTRVEASSLWPPSCPLSLRFALFGMSYKWNHPEYNLSKLTFSIQHDAS